jgi:hypothetical protein
VDRRSGEPSDKRVPLARVEEVLRLYREEYFDLNIRHFHEKLGVEHGIEVSYRGDQNRDPGPVLANRLANRALERFPGSS